MFRRYSAGSFTQATGINPSELESGGSNDDFKKVGQLADLVHEVGGDGWLGRHLQGGQGDLSPIRVVSVLPVTPGANLLVTLV